MSASKVCEGPHFPLHFWWRRQHHAARGEGFAKHLASYGCPQGLSVAWLLWFCFNMLPAAVLTESPTSWIVHPQGTSYILFIYEDTKGLRIAEEQNRKRKDCGISNDEYCKCKCIYCKLILPNECMTKAGTRHNTVRTAKPDAPSGVEALRLAQGCSHSHDLWWGRLPEAGAEWKRWHPRALHRKKGNWLCMLCI